MHFFCIATVCVGSVLGSECDELINANAQSLSLIRTIEVEYELETLDPSDSTALKSQWTKDGDLERFGRSHEPDRNSVDVVQDGETVRQLRNWVPNTPLTPTYQNGVEAEVRPQTIYPASAISPAYQLCMELSAVPKWSLAELAKVSPRTECKGKVDRGGETLWLIKLESPDDAPAEESKNRFEVFLDPSHGYAIRRLVVHRDEKLPDGRSRVYSHCHEVFEYKDFGDGVFLPIHVKHGTYSGGEDLWETEVKVRVARVNEVIPPEKFELKWPQFAIVKYFPAVNGQVKFDVWGSDGPIETFVGNVDLRRWSEDRQRTDPEFAESLSLMEQKLLRTNAQGAGFRTWLIAINVFVCAGAARTFSADFYIGATVRCFREAGNSAVASRDFLRCFHWHWIRNCSLGSNTEISCI